jgi:hypothetical protein
MQGDNIERARRLTGAFNRGDLDALEALSTAAEDGDRVVGRGFLRGTARSSAAHVEMRVTSTCVFRDGLVAEVRTLPDGA